MRAICLLVLGLAVCFGQEYHYGTITKFAAAAGGGGELINNTGPQYRWDYHNLASGQFSDWIDMSNSVHFKQAASSLQFTNSTTTGIYCPGIDPHVMTNAAPFTIGSTYSLAFIYTEFAFGGGEAFVSDTAANNDFFYTSAGEWNPYNGSAHFRYLGIHNIQYCTIYSVSSGTATTYTNNVAISGTSAAPTSWQPNMIFNDGFGDPLDANFKAFIIWNKALNATDVSNIWYEVNNQGF